jgi:hypothetical protein
MARIDQRLVDLLKTYGEDNQSVWDCHGTWVAYHAAVERMAAKASIIFEKPDMIVNNPDAKTVVVCVGAVMGERREWSFGEVSPANNKNGYPYAMAEKRAKDRVALKLLGMAGLVYSEEEADDFKASRPAQRSDLPHEHPGEEQPSKSSAQLKRDGEWERVTKSIAQDMVDVHTFAAFEALKRSYRDEAKKNGWNRTFLEQLADHFAGLEDRLAREVEKDNLLMAGE